MTTIMSVPGARIGVTFFLQQVLQHGSLKALSS
jgi:hypothetical protein